MRPSICSKCAFYEFMPQNLKVGHCVRFPPVPFALLNPNNGKIAHGHATAEVAADRPSCGEYAERLGAGAGNHAC